MENYVLNKNGIISNVCKGVLISIISTLILLLIFTTILTYTNISEDSAPLVIITITAISILIGSSIANLKIKKNGIFNGAIIGAIYFLLIYIISSIINMNFSFSNQMFILIGIGIVFGVLGGIIGVNKK